MIFEKIESENKDQLNEELHKKKSISLSRKEVVVKNFARTKQENLNFGI